MYELCELRRAFNTRNKSTVPTIRGAFSEPLKKLIRDCMAIDPGMRPSTDSLYQRFTLIDAASGRKDSAGNFTAIQL